MGDKYPEHQPSAYALNEARAVDSSSKFPPISHHGNVNEIIGKFGGAGQLRTAVNQLQSLLYTA